MYNNNNNYIIYTNRADWNLAFMIFIKIFEIEINIHLFSIFRQYNFETFAAKAIAWSLEIRKMVNL